MAILIIGRGEIGTTLNYYFKDSVLVSHQDFLNSLGIDGYDVADKDAVINCAGITGDLACKEAGLTKVLTANVEFPLKVANACRDSGVKCIQLSSAAIYQKQVSLSLDDSEYVSESEPVEGRNLYAASKIKMEELLADYPVHILRFGWFYINNNTFREKHSDRKWVPNTYVTNCHLSTLLKSIQGIIDDKLPADVYNIGTSPMHLPGWFESRGLYPKVVGDIPEDMSAATLLSTKKIEDILK